MNETQRRRLATHLVILNRRELLARPSTTSRSKAHEVAQARLNEACETASIVLGSPTGFAVAMDVHDACTEAGANWQGRLGAQVDSDWTDDAVARLLVLWENR